MKKIALTTEQMKRLQELGVDVSGASMQWLQMPTADAILNGSDDKDWNLFTVDNGVYDDGVLTFNLQDILELLPKDEFNIEIDGCKRACVLEWDIFDNVAYVKYWYYGYDEIYAIIGCNNNFGLLGIAYEMLCWCAENECLTK